eukprot:1031649-Prorocentrum_minimum.AAC.5
MAQDRSSMNLGAGRSTPRGRMLVASAILLIGFVAAQNEKREDVSSFRSSIEENGKITQFGTFCPSKNDSMVVVYGRFAPSLT